MRGRLIIVAVFALGWVLFAWLSADQPRLVVQPLPEPEARPVHDTPPAPADIAEVTLPAPPPLRVSAPETAPEPAQIPRQATVTPLAAPAQPQANITPLDAPIPIPAPKPTPKPIESKTPPKALTPLSPPARQQFTERQRELQEPQSLPTTKTVTKAAAREGRPLLKLLELGEGPSVEIAWPASAAERGQLYRVLSQCYGMRIALMTTDGALFDDDGAPGRPWAINMDRYSGFVRQSSGAAPIEEHRTARRIRELHRLAGATPVRVFPRAADAALLGGLKALIGPTYASAKRIRARYQITGWRISVGDVSADGRAVGGRIDLSGAVQRRCSI